MSDQEIAEKRFEQQNAQAVTHWAAATKARAEELRFIGMALAADRLDEMATMLHALAKKD